MSRHCDALAKISALVEDASYVEKVLDAELVRLTRMQVDMAKIQARTVLLDDITLSSIFFFVDPQYDSQEATSMIKQLDQKGLQQFGKSQIYRTCTADNPAESLEMFIPLLRENLEHLAEQRDDPLAIDEDTVYKTVNTVTSQLSLRARSQLMTPLRYALTGRKVSFISQSRLTNQKGPSVPTTMVTLGSRRSLARLEAGLKHLKKTIRERSA